jgi:tRNA pseudouridine55 synthase
MKLAKKNGILLINKPAGYTPLQLIQHIQKKYPEYREQTLSYAGRLDPMADGLLLLLLNEENKRRHEYEHLPKTYTFQILVGVSTDSYDVMGLINETLFQYDQQAFLETLSSWVQQFQGKQTIFYPLYSSKPVQGKPLYWYAIHNKLSSINLPSQDIMIHNVQINEPLYRTAEEIQKSIHQRIERVEGNFRQELILNQWDQTLKELKDISFLTVTCTLSCESGAYVRGIVHTLSEALHIPTLTYSITRTSIGPYTLKDITVF